MNRISIFGGLLLCLSLHACQGSDKPEVGSDASASLEEQVEQLGKSVYDTRCAQCHQANGQGIPGSFPSLTQTEWVLGDKGRLVRLLLNGMQGPLELEGEVYNGTMILPPPALTDEQVAAVLTYVRQHFGNDAEAVTPDEVASVRAANEQKGLWEASELLERTGLPGA